MPFLEHLVVLFIAMNLIGVVGGLVAIPFYLLITRVGDEDASGVIASVVSYLVGSSLIAIGTAACTLDFVANRDANIAVYGTAGVVYYSCT